MEYEAIRSTWKKVFLFLNSIFFIIGSCGGPLIIRLYFINGGKRIWLNSFLQTAGFPIVLIPLTIDYVCRRLRKKDGVSVDVCLMKPGVFIASSIIGLLTGIYLFFTTGGLSRLPASTSSLVFSTQLAFTAMFAYFLVKQNFTSYSVNAIVLLTAGAVVLGLDSSGDRPVGESRKEYALGFFLIVAAAALGGLILPLQELIYRTAKQKVTYTLVLEIQMTITAVACSVCIAGMFMNGDFQAISMEAKEFKLGETMYYLVLLCTCILMQFFCIGCAGVVFYGSSLLSGIISTVALPITQLLSVIFFHERFEAEKGVALFLCLWGFVSYFYGEKKHYDKTSDHIKDSDTDVVTQLLPDHANV